FTVDDSGNVVATGTVTGSNLSGTNTGDQIAGAGLTSSGAFLNVGSGLGITVTGDEVNANLVPSGSTTTGMVRYNGTSRSSGMFYGGSTNPVSTNRLNYDGNLYATTMFAGNFTLTSDRRAKTKIKPIDLPPLDIE